MSYRDGPPVRRSGPHHRAAIASDHEERHHLEPSVQHPADTEPVLRLPCRTRGCSGTRPVVLLGSSWGFDRCVRCAGRTLRARPYPVPDDRPAVDPWAERIAEVLETAELATAGRWSA